MKLLHVLQLHPDIAAAAGNITLREATTDFPDPPTGSLRRVRVDPDTGRILVVDITEDGSETVIWTFKSSLGQLVQLPLPPWMLLSDRETEKPGGQWTTRENAAKLMAEYTRAVYRVIDQDRR